MAFTNEPSPCPPRSARRAVWCRGRAPSAKTGLWTCPSPRWSLPLTPRTPWSVRLAGRSTAYASPTARKVAGGGVLARTPSGVAAAADLASIRWPPLQRLFQRPRRKWLWWLRFCPYRRHGLLHQIAVDQFSRWSGYYAQVVGGIEPCPTDTTHKSP